MNKWSLEVRLHDAVERAHFESREDAIEHANAIVDDYDASVMVILIDPDRRFEKIALVALGLSNTH